MFTAATGKEIGTERIWIIWAAHAVPLLDNVVKHSFPRLEVSLPTDQAALKRFIEEHASRSLEVTEDKAQLQVTLKGRDEIFVHMLELEHRDWK